MLWGTDSIRQWATALGVVAGSVAAASFGAYDTMAVAQASWIGTPPGAPLKLDLQFGPEFWAILPAFLFLTLVASTKSVGVAVAIQRVSWRGSRAVDFRSVQGTLAAEGTGNVLAGPAGNRDQHAVSIRHRGGGGHESGGAQRRGWQPESA